MALLRVVRLAGPILFGACALAYVLHATQAAPVPLDVVAAQLDAVLADADLLVTGAAYHSRVRELLFGGVTGHVMRHATIPLLMAH